MYYTTSETEGEVDAVKSINPPVIFYNTDRSKAVLLIWVSVFACFGVSCVLFSPSINFQKLTYKIWLKMDQRFLRKASSIFYM